MRESRIQQLVRLAAEKYALSIEWKGEDYGARKRYYRDAFLAGYAHAQSELAKAREENARLRKALEKIAGNRYGLQGLIEDGASDVDIAAFWSRECSIFQAAAREALADPVAEKGE